MNIQPSDILVRAVRSGQQTVWVSERLLVSVCDGLTNSYLRQKARYEYLKTVPTHRRKQDIMPDTEASWRFGKFGGQFYYDLERIPDKAPAQYRSKLPSADELLEMLESSKNDQRFSALEKVVKKAVTTDYTGFYPAYTGYDVKKTDALARCAAALEAVHRYIMANEVDVRKNEVFADFSLCVSRFGLPYLPSNVRRLKEKVLRLLGGETATEVVTLPREGNANAKKYDDPEVISWLMVMRSAGFNTTAVYISRRVQKLCALNDKRVPSISWLEHYLATTQTKNLTPRRYGANGRLAMNYSGYVPMAGAVYAGDVWMMDGTRVNFIEFTHDGNTWQHLVVVMVYDLHSGAMVGRSYGTAENRWLYQDALAKAATRYGYLPHTIVCDRFPGHNTPEWGELTAKMRRIGTTMEVVHTMQGKAKMERAIDVVQMAGMQTSDKYYGQGVQSRRDYAHRSEETLNEMRKRARSEGWNMEQAIQEAEKAFERYNEMPYNEQSTKRTIKETPLQLHDSSEKPHAYKANGYEMLHLFGFSKRIQVRNMGMIVTEINKVKYTYVVAASDWSVIRKHKEVVMYYDLEDLDRVQLYTATDRADDEQFLCEATEQKAVQWAGPSKDEKAMGKARKRIADIKKQNAEEMARHMEIAGTEDRVLLGIGTDKETRETAETAWLMERANRPKRAVPQPVDNDEEEPMIDVVASVRSQY